MNSRPASASIVLLFTLAATLAWTFSSVAEDVPVFDLATAVGIWLLDEGAGDVAEDASGNGNDGDLMAGPEWVDGRFGQALRFDGNFVWVRQPADLPMKSEARTIVCFFRWPEVLWPAIGDRRPPGVGGGGSAILGYGPMQFRERVSVWLDDDEAVGVETAFDTVLAPWEGDTEWHHLAVVFPPGATKMAEFLIYLDGQRQDTVVENDPNRQDEITTAVGPLTIGCQSGTNSLFYEGIVDDVAVFPSALPDEHIRSIARNGLVRGPGGVAGRQARGLLGNPQGTIVPPQARWQASGTRTTRVPQ